MFGFGGGELLVIGIVALVVLGPRDLPRVAHRLGRWTRAARRTLGDLRAAFETMSDEVAREPEPPPAPPSRPRSAKPSPDALPPASDFGVPAPSPSPPPPDPAPPPTGGSAP